MAAKTKWWQEQTAQCEDATARALIARDGLTEAQLWVRGLIRRNAGNPDDLKTLLAIMTYTQQIVDEHLTRLRAERGSYDATSK